MPPKSQARRGTGSYRISPANPQCLKVGRSNEQIIQSRGPSRSPTREISVFFPQPRWRTLRRLAGTLICLATPLRYKTFNWKQWFSALSGAGPSFYVLVKVLKGNVQ